MLKKLLIWMFNYKMDYITLIGALAGILTTTAFLPQVIKTWKTKQTKDISLGMFAILTIGVVLWLVYGILINSLPVIISNVVTFILALAILILKIRYK